MYGRTGLDRFKKAQSSEPFSLTSTNSTVVKPPITQPPPTLTSSPFNQPHLPSYHNTVQKTVTSPSAVPAQQVTQVGGGQSNWQPPDWAIEPRPGVHYLDVVKEGEVVDRINLDKRRHIFGRQFHTCDFVIEHQSVSRQHAAVVPHKNGSIYVIDLGSAHGTFVANERLTKDSPIELEAGQSLRFAASTRTYILRKNEAALFPPQPQPTEIDLPPPPDPTDEEAVVAYNTFVNRALNGLSNDEPTDSKDDIKIAERASKRIRRIRVAFRDQVGGELVEVVGFSDGADVETEPGPVGVKEGSLVGKYESLVQITVIPKGQGQSSTKDGIVAQKGVTDKLQQVLNKVKGNNAKSGGMYDDLYGESSSVKMGTSWALAGPGGDEASLSKNGGNSKNVNDKDEDDDDDLFG